MSVRATIFFNACKANRAPKDQQVGDVTLAFQDGTIQCWVKGMKADQPMPSCPAVFLFTPGEFRTAKQFIFALRQHLTAYNLRLTRD
jgi:hypothetical protein